MKTRLPPLGTLLAFEAAAQFCSFSGAAKHLYVTPAAISQQIHSLESHLELTLFVRSKSGVKLTRAGESFLRYVHASLEQLRQGQQHLAQFKNLEVLTITALPSVAQKWLMPLVLEWMAINPDTQIRIEASHQKVNFNHSASDMCISYGEKGYEDLQRLKLLTDSVTLVVSPVLYSQSSSLDSLLKQPMLHVDWGDDNDSLPQWADWLAYYRQKNTQTEVDEQRGPRFNLSSMAIDAAVQSKGLLLGQQLLVRQEIENKTLIAPTDIHLPLGESYYLVYPERTLEHKKASAFIEWMSDQLSQIAT